MADSAPQIDYVKRPAYPEMTRPAKVRRAPQATAQRAQPASIAQIGARKQKPMDAMEAARAIRLAGTIAGRAR